MRPTAGMLNVTRGAFSRSCLAIEASAVAKLGPGSPACGATTLPGPSSMGTRSRPSPGGSLEPKGGSCLRATGPGPERIRRRNGRDTPLGRAPGRRRFAFHEGGYGPAIIFGPNPGLLILLILAFPVPNVLFAQTHFRKQVAGIAGPARTASAHQKQAGLGSNHPWLVQRGPRKVPGRKRRSEPDCDALSKIAAAWLVGYWLAYVLGRLGV